MVQTSRSGDLKSPTNRSTGLWPVRATGVSPAESSLNRFDRRDALSAAQPGRPCSGHNDCKSPLLEAQSQRDADGLGLAIGNANVDVGDAPGDGDTDGDADGVGLGLGEGVGLGNGGMMFSQ
jgi:hypothetical protein